MYLLVKFDSTCTNFAAILVLEFKKFLIQPIQSIQIYPIYPIHPIYSKYIPPLGNVRVQPGTLF